MYPDPFGDGGGAKRGRLGRGGGDAWGAKQSGRPWSPEFEVASAGEDGFGDVGLGDLDAQVVVDGPEAGVEEIVGGGINNGV